MGGLGQKLRPPPRGFMSIGTQEEVREEAPALDETGRGHVEGETFEEVSNEEEGEEVEPEFIPRSTPFAKQVHDMRVEVDEIKQTLTEVIDQFLIRFELMEMADEAMNERIGKAVFDAAHIRTQVNNSDNKAVLARVSMLEKNLRMHREGNEH